MTKRFDDLLHIPEALAAQYVQEFYRDMEVVRVPVETLLLFRALRFYERNPPFQTLLACLCIFIMLCSLCSSNYIYGAVNDVPLLWMAPVLVGVFICVFGWGKMYNEHRPQAQIARMQMRVLLMGYYNVVDVDYVITALEMKAGKKGQALLAAHGEEFM